MYSPSMLILVLLMHIEIVVIAWRRPPHVPNMQYKLNNRFASNGPVAAIADHTIVKDQTELDSSTLAFDLLRRLSNTQDKFQIDFKDFVPALEQAFAQGKGLDSNAVRQLRLSMGISDLEDGFVTMDSWSNFYSEWCDKSSVESYLEALTDKQRADFKLKTLDESWKQSCSELQTELAGLKKRILKEVAVPPGPSLNESPKRRRKKESANHAQTPKKKGNSESPVKSSARIDWGSAYGGSGGGLTWAQNDVGQDASARPQLMAEMVQTTPTIQRTLDPLTWTKVTKSIGGMDDSLETIRRRIWVPLCTPSTVLEELGTSRVKGLLLHGPPGCGKSLLASKLAASLSHRPPTIVSGPEIMDKFVGGSESQLRALFTEPPAVPPRDDYTEEDFVAAQKSELHVIVLDEFDAIARRRTDSDSSRTTDSVVNQLLALMDGVGGLPVPTFVIALTNRRELVDSAVLRPGRLEVHVGVGRPDILGRGSILRIHTEKMQHSGRLVLADWLDRSETHAADGTESAKLVEEAGDSDAVYKAWTEEIAAQTEGFSGAAIAAVVRAAVARALDRSVAQQDANECRVTSIDFDEAIADVRKSTLEVPIEEQTTAACKPRQSRLITLLTRLTAARFWKMPSA